MDHVSKRTIVETVETAREYRNKLEELIKSVLEAEGQIKQSSHKAIAAINTTFSQLQKHLVDVIEQRQNSLKVQVQEIEGNGLWPLEECKKQIESRKSRTELFIKDLEKVLSMGGMPSEKNNSFYEEASLLGSLPAVPDLELVPDITFHSTVDTLSTDIEKEITKLGNVSKMGPVQICSIEEKPGSLLIHWEEVDFELQGDIQYYKLQSAHDDVRGKEILIENNFHDVYTGSELEHLVRDLQWDTPYSFRVCCKSEAESDWSAWSLIKVSKTRVIPFAWEPINPHYSISNDNKLASKLNTETCIIFSNEAQVCDGHSIEFTIVSSADGLSEEGIALTNTRDITSLVENGVFFCNMDGKIYIDGAPKLTSLPRLAKGSKITFSCERLDKSRLRVNVDSGCKAVTYDWKITSPRLWFAALFIQPGFKILVQ